MSVVTKFTEVVGIEHPIAPSRRRARWQTDPKDTNVIDGNGDLPIAPLKVMVRPPERARPLWPSSKRPLAQVSVVAPPLQNQ